MGLAALVRLSVSVPYGLLTGKHNGANKTKIGLNIFAWRE